MTYPDFAARWRNSGGAERANYGLFLQDLCDLLGVPKPDPTTDNPTQDQYVLERAVTFQDGPKKSTGRIDLYKRGCFILETKQGVGTFAGLDSMTSDVGRRIGIGIGPNWA
ncbi:MAG TPA: type IIL restriction-modification enzyme MmeI [Hymenobacter sp.]|jgi:hypothetical protein